MKKRLFVLTITSFFILGCSSFTWAVVDKNTSALEIALNPELAKTQSLHKKESNKIGKNESKLTRKLAKLKKKSKSKSAIPKNSNRKWFWLWLGGWLLGIIVYILQVVIANSTVTAMSNLLGIIGISIFLFGTICLVIWLIKKFGKKEALHI